MDQLPGVRSVLRHHLQHGRGVFLLQGRPDAADHPLPLQQRSVRYGRAVYLPPRQRRRRFWSPSWMPTRHEAEKYFCRHGMGYTVIGSTFKKIEAQTRYFVPLGENLEIWQCTVTNRRKNPAKLSVFSSVEFCLWDAWDDQPTSSEISTPGRWKSRTG